MDKNTCIVLVLVLFEYLQTVRGHSWLACTDYEEKNAAYYDHNKCRAYARAGSLYAPRGGTFAQDRGFDHIAGTGPVCIEERNDVTWYDSTHPMAVYYPGQQVVLAHPMKNHGSDTCTNAFIPDNGNFIYRGEKDASADYLTMAEYEVNLVADLGTKDSSLPLGQYPRPGYQNAPAFCEDTGASLGTYSFNVPSDIEPGVYTFVWVWHFNSVQPGDTYNGCFEVEIVGSVEERNSRLLANGFTTYEPCGGMTSEKNTPGNTNPGCTSDGDSTTTTTTATSATTAATSTAATSTVAGTVQLETLADQIAGVINLPTAAEGTVRRYITITWDCSVTLKVWPARVVSVNTERPVQYDIVQEGSDVNEGKIYYHASFSESCNQLLYPATSVLTQDEM